MLHDGTYVRMGHRSTALSLLAAVALAAPATLILPGCGGGGGGGGGGKGSTAAGAVAAPPGPQVEVISPRSAAAVTGASVLVEGVVVDDGHGVVRVAVNGVDVAAGPGPFQASAPVEPGVNTLVVEAWDARGGRTERHVSVLGGPLRPADQAIARGAEVALAGAAAPLVANFQTQTTSGGASAVPNGMPPTRFIAAHSGNYTRRSGRTIRYIIIHTIEGSEAGCISWFQNPASRVSAHYVLSHAGRVTQMVRDEDRAWHAGNYNEQSIGIENEGWAGRNNWTDTQYRVLAQLTRALCDRYGIPKTRAHILAHSEVASHKSDPGRFFDWDRFMTLVRGTGATTTTSPRPSTQTVTLGNGRELAVAWSPRPVTTSGGVSRVELDVNVAPRTPLPGRLASSVVLGTPRAAASQPTGNAAGNVGLAVHQDLLNRSLQAAWRGGALDLRLTPSSLALLAPGTTGTLDRDALVAQDPALGALLPPGSSLAIELTPALPPTARVLPRGELALRVGALEARLDRIDAGGTTPLGVVTLALDAPAWVEGHGPTARLATAGPGEVRADVAPGQAAGLDRLAHALAPALRDAALGALAGVPLPTPPGIDLVGLSLGTSGDTVTGVGTAR
ncbi:MAG: N-acetylmuramoyl-L-alanine amidase [Planctomycetes bacterium]|nr:N-acetylmuramoyl-L-alanine amidase [Planctomycetota bacterium]